MQEEDPHRTTPERTMAEVISIAAGAPAHSAAETGRSPAAISLSGAGCGSSQ